MGSWNVTTMVVIIGIFFALLAVVLANINVTNPYTGIEQSILGQILSWISPF